MAVLLDGVRVNLSGKEFTVPPLNLKSLRRLGPQMKSLSNMGEVPGEEHVDAIVDVLHAALVRNYPELTADDVAEHVDLGNLHTVLGAVLSVSGLVERGGGAPPGEGQSSRS